MGWIKLDRKIKYNRLWLERPFSRGQAWVDLLLLANHTDREYVYGDKTVVGKRGDVNVSLSWLADRWGWSRGKVRRFVRELTVNRMCSVSSTPHGTTLSIENYAFYQDGRPTDGTQTDIKRTSNGTSIDHTQEEKKEELKKNNILIPLVSDVERYVEENGFDVDPLELYDYYAGQGWKKANGMPVKDWKACVRSWHRKHVKEKQGGTTKSDARAERLAEMEEQERKEIEELNRKAEQFRKEKQK